MHHVPQPFSLLQALAKTNEELRSFMMRVNVVHLVARYYREGYDKGGKEAEVVDRAIKHFLD